MVQRDARYMAAVQGIIGWEWMVSGADKVLSGTFPAALAGTLRDGMQGNPNGWYVAVLRSVVLPRSVFAGYVIEVAEVLTGLALLSGAFALLVGIRRRGEPQYVLAVGQLVAAAIAAFTCIVLCVNFHFFMGDSLLPGLNPGHAFQEGIDLDTLLPPVAVLVLAFNVYVLRDVTGVSLLGQPRRIHRSLHSLGAPGHPAVSSAADGVGA